MSPIEEFEEDLAEIKNYQPNARRIFWTGANPFAMSYENLKLRALTVRDYLIEDHVVSLSTRYTGSTVRFGTIFPLIAS